MSNGMCTEIVDDGRRVCGKPVTDEVSWPDVTRAECPPATPDNPFSTFTLDENGRIKYTATYPHNVVKHVCGSCADWLMGLDVASQTSAPIQEATPGWSWLAEPNAVDEWVIEAMPAQP